MIASIEDEALEMIFKLQPIKPEQFRGVFSSVSQQLVHPEISGLEAPQNESLAPQNPERGPALAPPHISSHEKVGRNDPCPCGKIDPKTGNRLKYKKCCYPNFG